MRSILFSVFPFRPHLFKYLKQYNRTLFVRDVIAGLTVSVVALPLAMAFSIASGVAPESGIFTAIIAGFLISALGGTRIQIGGPAGAFIIVVYGIVEQYGLANLFICTMCAGVLLFMMGMFRLGSLIRFIPIAVVIGFTNGIAVLVAVSQLRDFFGLHINKMPADFFSQINIFAKNIHTVDFLALVVGLLSLLLIIAWPRLANTVQSYPNRWQKTLHVLSKIPSIMVVLVISTLTVSLLDLPIDTIGSRFGGIPQGLPDFAVPNFSWILAKQLFAPTITLTLLGAIESLLCARISDRLMHDHHNPNQELMAQGIANFVVPFFGGIPATGTIGRTITNFEAGARSPISGIVSSLTLLAIILVAAPLAKNIPLSALAGILLFIAFKMGQWREFYKLSNFSLNYRIIMITTFFITVIFDLTAAVQVGLILSCLFFIYRISNLTHITSIPTNLLPHKLEPDIAAYAIFGSLFFGSVDKIEELAKDKNQSPKVIILELHQLINIDTTGLEALMSLHETLSRRDCRLILCGANNQPKSLMDRGEFLSKIGTQNYFATLEEAIIYANSIVSQPNLC